MDKETADSFFHEYKYKLSDIHEKLYTKRGKKIAEGRKTAAEAFYENLYREVTSSFHTGPELLAQSLE